jgi:hypothetical protein
MTAHKLNLTLLADKFGICRMSADAGLPAWLGGELVSVTRTAEELSVVCRADAVPDSVRCEKGWRCLRVAGTLDFALVGVLASLVGPLAEAWVSVFAVSTFNTDYLLVKEADLERAVRTLETAGHCVQR